MIGENLIILGSTELEYELEDKQRRNNNMVDCRTCEHYHAEFTDVLSIRVWCDAYNDSMRMMNSLDCKKFKKIKEDEE